MSQKNAVVVGGSSGIGHRIVQDLLEGGYAVTNVSRSKGQLSDQVQHVEADVLAEKWPSTEEFPEAIDALVYCPGSINLKPFRSLKAEDFQKDFEINLLGAVKTLQYFQKPLKKSDQSSVVLFSTVAVQQGMPFHASVASAKGAIEGLVRSLAAEWAPKIRVNAVAPSLVDTPMASQLLSSDSKKENANDRHPLNRYGQPEDIANAVTFLLNPASSWMSGQVLGVDGGLSRLRI